ncbi:hypothetical protein HPB47_001850, partial [Ixodes persulcatus]
MPERLVSLIGLNRLDDLHVLEILRLLALDFAVLFASVATLLVSNTPVVDETTRPCPQSRWRVHSAVMGDFLVLLLMAGAAVLQASLSSLVYFAVFLGTATRLGMHLPLAEGYRLLRTCLMLYSAAHILVLYAYQLDYLQGLVPPSSLEARLIGLSPLRVAPCTGDESALADFRLLVFRRLHWTLYLSPLAVLGFYFVVATVTRYQLLQKTGCRLLTRGSYMLTLIVMMAWSITYHSWLTFVLLIWSCVLWMMPSSRQACLRSSPALVAYAELLLLLQYLYSLDLTDKELPQHVNTVNLAQLGLIKYAHDAYQPLSLKQLLAPWSPEQLAVCVDAEALHAELFGRFHSYLRRRGSTVTFSISTQLLVRRLGRLVQQWLTRYWIWVVASMLMFISLGGEQVVLYRIVYMLLFLFFVTVFQVSYQLWIKVMYGFWLTVIIYSMLVLILIYSYQFEHFPEYWEHHLRIPVGFQKDIGLEVYQADPGTLFLKLLTPTFFLIITIIQLHYFHNEFIKLNEDNFTY